MNILAIGLALSVAANVALGWAYLEKRDTAVVASTDLKHAGADVKACNASVDGLGEKTEARAAAAAPARAVAQNKADGLNRQADAILSTPAAVQGDDCKSVQARANEWFKESP